MGTVINIASSARPHPALIVYRFPPTVSGPSLHHATGDHLRRHDRRGSHRCPPAEMVIGFRRSLRRPRGRATARAQACGRSRCFDGLALRPKDAWIE